MKQKNPLFRNISFILILVCSLEFIFIGYIYLSSPPLPPEISAYDYDEDELVEKAEKIYKDYFSYPQHFSSEFHYMFYFVKSYCKSIYKKSYSGTNKLENYNNGVKILKEEFSRVFIMLLSIFLICIIASLLILNNKFVFMASFFIVLLSILPLRSGFLVGSEGEFLFYWTIPILVLGIIIFLPLLFKYFLNSPRLLGVFSSIFYGSPFREMIRGIFLIVIGVGITAIIISLAREMGYEYIVVSPPIFLVLYGIFLILRAALSIFKKPVTFKTTNKVQQKIVNVKKKGFICPDCNNITLVIIKSIELGPDSRSDEYSLQAIECKKCGLVGVSTYQESRRGAEDSWEHIGYKMEKEEYKKFLELLNYCNNSTNIKCTCTTHNHFIIKNNYGVLNPLEKLKYRPSHFQLIFEDISTSQEQVKKKKISEFICPDCNNNTLKISKSIELGPDSRSDEYSLQAIECKKCGLVGVSTYQESRRGAGESWGHLGYKMEKDEYKKFLNLLNNCINPTNIKCTCTAHCHFNVKDNYDTLKPLEKLKIDHYHFQIKI